MYRSLSYVHVGLLTCRSTAFFGGSKNFGSCLSLYSSEKLLQYERGIFFLFRQVRPITVSEVCLERNCIVRYGFTALRMVLFRISLFHLTEIQVLIQFENLF